MTRVGAGRAVESQRPLTGEEGGRGAAGCHVRKTRATSVGFGDGGGGHKPRNAGGRRNRQTARKHSHRPLSFLPRSQCLRHSWGCSALLFLAGWGEECTGRRTVREKRLRGQRERANAASLGATSAPDTRHDGGKRAGNACSPARRSPRLALKCK